MIFFKDRFYYFTACLSSLPGLKAGTLVAGIVIASPVCGLRPLRSARSLTSKVPKPTNCNFSPLAKAS